MSTDSKINSKRDLDEPDLAGLEELLATYQRSPQQQPPAALDQRILAAAAQTQTVTTLPVRQPRARWSAPLALAATMVLGVGLVTLIQHELPQHELPQHELPQLDSTAPTVAPLRERAADSANDVVPDELMQESVPAAAPLAETSLSDQPTEPAAKASPAASTVSSESIPMPESDESRRLQQFAPSPASFMINYRVDNIHALVAALRAEGCNVLGDVDESDYGKFAWVIDPEGNKVELWEPPAGQ